MIRGLFAGTFSIRDFIFWIIALVIAFTIHEFAHGFAAYVLGDRTAKNDGRLSLNPRRHIDPMGLVMILLAGFGWAKPVMVNTFILKNPKQDMAFISFAGPLSNFIMAFLAMAIHIFILNLIIFSGVNNIVVTTLGSFFGILALINVNLGIFNLLPIPPLDGSKFFGMILPDTSYFKFTQSPYGFWVLLLLIFTGAIPAILQPISSAILSGFIRVLVPVITMLF